MKYRRVYLAEKNSQVKALAVVENAKLSGGVAYNHEKGIAIIPLQGHILKNLSPKKYLESVGKFSEETIDKFPQRLQLEINPKLRGKFATAVEHLKEAEEIVIATDFDEEGAAIAMNVIERLGLQDRVSFMLDMGSTHPKELQAAIENPIDIPYQNMAEAARARAWIDFVEGMYYSVAYSVYLGDNYRVKINYGGVKAPLTYIVVKRDLENKGHTKTYFWTVLARLSFGEHEFEAILEFKNAEDKWVNRFDSEAQAKAAFEKFLDKELKIASFSSKKKSTIPPKLCELATVQSEMSTRFSLSPSKTLEIAQKLYDSPISIQTYPRTDVPYLKEKEYEDVPTILGNLISVMPEHKSEIEAILSGTIPKRKSTFNDKEVVPHGAIVPTLSGDYEEWFKKINQYEKEEFKFIAKRYIANFMPDYEYLSVSGFTEEVDGMRFKFSENVPLKAGWRKIFEPNIEEKINNYQRAIPEDLSKGDLVKVVSLKDERGETKPKPLFTMSTLLMAMKNVASLFPEEEKIQKYLKEDGIGTPATRDKIIDEVMDKEKNGGEPFLYEENKKIRSTKKALEFISYSPAALVSPIKRAILSQKLKMISKGELTYEELVEEYRKSVKKNIEVIKQIAKEKGTLSGGNAKERQKEPLGKCPICGSGDIFESKNAFICSEARFKKLDSGEFVNEGCSYMISKKGLSKLGKPEIKASEVKRLLKNGKAEVTLKSKSSGKSYKADMVVDTKYGIKVEFNFEGEKKELPSLGSCPVCGTGQIVEKARSYQCTNAKFKKEGDKFINEGCNYSIRKNSLERYGKQTISPEEVKELLLKGSVTVNLKAMGNGKKYTAEAVVDTKYGIAVNFQ